MADELEPIFEEFRTKLDERFSDKKFTTEDTIRYLFFYACTKNGVEPNDITLESKGIFNTSITKNAELDMMIESENLSESVAIEFKYHRREGMEGKAKPQEYWAGKLLYDFYRLQNITASAGKRLSVYVASKEMQENYTQMPAYWNLGGLLGLKRGETTEISIFENPDTDSKKDLEFWARTKGFGRWNNKRKEQIEAASGFRNAHVQCLFTKDLAGGNVLRIFEIK